jgi:hypothetical protein
MANSHASVTLVLAVLVGAGQTSAAEISGTITATLTVFNDSKLVGDVTCQVTGAPCIIVQNPFAVVTSTTLDLNGFTMTGKADPQMACSAGGVNGNESGILVTGQSGVVIRGPGVVESFRGSGITLNNVRSSTVTGVTTAGNCSSGILVTGGSAYNALEGNISISNGNLTNPCGGI